MKALKGPEGEVPILLLENYAVILYKNPAISIRDLRHIPVIVFIGAVPERLIKQLYELGANTVIARPLLWNEVFSVLEKICDDWFVVLKM